MPPGPSPARDKQRLTPRGLSGAALLALYLAVALGVLLFLLVHPFLYAVPRLGPDPMRAVAFVQRMFTMEWYRSGVIAWALLVLVPMGIFRDRLPFRYEVWRASHGLGAALIAGFGLHHTLAVGSHSADRLLAAFWIALAGLAILTLLFVYIVKPLMQLRRPYRVVANRQVADRTWELVVNPERDAPVMGILRQLRAERWRGRLLLVYGNRLATQILYREELESIAAEMQLDLKLVLSEPPPGWRGPVGELSTEMREACLDPLERERWIYFVCGPPPMMNSVERSLLSFRVPGRQIIAERFKYD